VIAPADTRAGGEEAARLTDDPLIDMKKIVSLITDSVATIAPEL
jgi:hypothetical protein